MDTYISPETGLALVRATEPAALQAGRYIGLGDRHAAHQAATSYAQTSATPTVGNRLDLSSD